MAKGSRLTGVAERPITPEMSRNSGPSSHAQAKGTTSSGRRRQGVNRPDDAPAEPAQRVRARCHGSRDPTVGRDREPVCEPHDSTGEPGAGNQHAGLCVQPRLACSAGDSPAGARIRSPVAWIAGRRETKFLKPIDRVSLGEIASHRAVT